jgi:hypothetical protein
MIQRWTAITSAVTDFGNKAAGSDGKCSISDREIGKGGYDTI